MLMRLEWLSLLFTGSMLAYAGFVLRSAWHFSRIRCQASLPDPAPFVSVLIPARNEERRIAACLHSVLNQDYPAGRFEVILVNDHSTDATREIALLFSLRYPNLRLLDLDERPSNAYKKAALSLGAAKAQGEILVQTDADCEMGPQWLKRMVAQFGERTALVSGPVRLLYRDAWLERLQALESMGLVALGAGSMAAERPNMCNGANLAYRKSVFEQVGGFEGLKDVASGDDELLLQKVHLLGGYELRFAKCRDAIVYTHSLPSWAELKAQRLRWVSKARNYLDRRVNLVQALSYLAFLSLPLSALLGLLDPRFAVLAAELFLLKVLADCLLMYQAARFFHNLRLLRQILLLQLVYIPYVLWIGIAGNLVKEYAWKGRRVR
jgi:cellulose synthase/poly-beta-1,6-N-acetylglucosamine synthase-like glycosyltransferase